MKNMMSEDKKQKSIIRHICVALSPSYMLRPERRHYLLFKIILLVVAFIVISGNWYIFDRSENYRIGYPSAKTYFALTSARYEDKPATLELRQRAAARIVDVMVQDEKIAAEVSKRLTALENGQLSSIPNSSLLELFNGLSPESRSEMIEIVTKIGREIRNEAETRDQQSALIWKHLKRSSLTQSEKNIAFQILDTVLNPSLQHDAEMTARLRDDVSTHIPAVIRDIHQGAVLVQKGQLVTKSLAELLQSQGYPDAAYPFKQLVFILIAIFIWSFWPEWIESGLKQKLEPLDWIYIACAVSVTWVLEVAFARICGVYSMAVLGITGWLCLTLPVSVSYHVILGGGIISVMIAFGANPSIVALGFILTVFSASIGRMFFLNSPSHRGAIWRRLFILGLCLSAVSFGVHWGLGISYDYTLPLYGLLFSAVWSTIVIAFLPIWESFFGVISPLRLLELCDQSQPLLKRLQLEAPGTFHHTLMVGSLAEAAADKLDMNGLMVRAGAYYHDIGKLKNPRYFVENQLRGENVHDKLSPEISAQLLISHVKDGLAIAEENRLPKILRRFIAEHHGTTLQKYFYDKAQLLGENVVEQQFRYPGPKPQSLETALIMLADSVEAAVKAKNKPFENIKELQKLVDSVVKSKIDAGQLSDTDFTMRELQIIKRCFVDVLRSTYHSREVADVADTLKALKNSKESKIGNGN
jgi:putative nucleotidyltransferase with HDIG domain